MIKPEVIAGKGSAQVAPKTEGMAQTHAQTVRVEFPQMGRPTGAPFWLDLTPEPVYAVLHTPSTAERTSVAVLIMPTFGWDNDWSYRPRRAWAQALAEAGVTTLRFDFPGTEDSVGAPLAADRGQSWIDATVSAAAWLRKQSECDRLVVLGVGLGGLLACEAIAAGAQIDDLVLWGTRVRGRAHVRELRTFAAVVEEAADAERDGERTDGVVGIGGHRISEATLTMLGSISLEETPLPHSGLRNVLLIGRDAHGVDQKLRLRLEESGATVSVLEADDYMSLVGRGELQLTPVDTIAKSIEWILANLAGGDLTPIAHAPAGDLPRALDAISFEHNGVRIRESLVEVVTGAGRVCGIVSEPELGGRDPHCLVLTNAGTLRRTGPGRLSTELGRSAAAAGTPAARFDLPGLGDSDGAAIKPFERTPDDDAVVLGVISEIYDHLERIGVATGFVPGGLCLGGYFAVSMIPKDRRSIAALGVNAPTLRWGETQRRAVMRSVTAEAGPVTPNSARSSSASLPPWLNKLWVRVVRWRNATEARARVRLAGVDLLWRPLHRAELSSAAQAVDRLGDAGVPVFFALSAREPLVHTFAQPQLKRRLQRLPNLRVEYLGTNDHDLRPLWSQDLLLEHVGRMLAELRGAANSVSSGVKAQAPVSAADDPALENERPTADD
jgi:alpha-beta hydrolase superfamily lysophospholipase